MHAFSAAPCFDSICTHVVGWTFVTICCICCILLNVYNIYFYIFFSFVLWNLWQSLDVKLSQLPCRGSFVVITAHVLHEWRKPMLLYEWKHWTQRDMLLTHPSIHPAIQPDLYPTHDNIPRLPPSLLMDKSHHYYSLSTASRLQTRLFRKHDTTFSLVRHSPSFIQSLYVHIL